MTLSSLQEGIGLSLELVSPARLHENRQCALAL